MVGGRKQKARGLAALSPEERKKVSARGGRAAHEKGTAHEWSREECVKQGQKGGRSVSPKPGHMAALGRKGGGKVSENREHMADIGQRGGDAVSSDRGHMAEIGRKGGEARRKKKDKKS